METNTNATRAMSYLNALNVIAYLANLGFVNFVPSLFDLPDNATMSAKYQTIVTPAGFAFAIWGLIFMAQLIWAAVQLVMPSYRSSPLVVEGVGYKYLAVCACQVAWTFAFALEQFVMSMIFMLGILFYLLQIHISIRKVLTNSDASFRQNHSFWLLRFPFDLHLGWIVAATLVNFNVLLQAHVGSAAVKFIFGIMTIASAAVVAAAVLFFEKDAKAPNVVIPLVLVWALNAISTELANPKALVVETYDFREIHTIMAASGGAAMMVLIAAIAIVARAIWRHQRAGRTEETMLLSDD